MLRVVKICLVLVALSVSTAIGQERSTAEQLQDISVTIDSGAGQGSGVVITREVELSKTNKNKVTVNFVWTAGHVVDNLRSTRTVVEKGAKKEIVQFNDANVVQELQEDGRKVGEVRMTGKVIKWSHPEDGDDLALLFLYKKNFVNNSAKFYLEDKVVPVGTHVLNVGSALGQFGSNSVLPGIISQTGRVLDINQSGGVVFDQTSTPSYPGCSGSGVYFEDGPDKAKMVGMLVRGAGPGFNFIVPVRRMKEWAKTNGVYWAMDEKVIIPSLEEILKLPVDDIGTKAPNAEKHPVDHDDEMKYPYLLKIKD